MGPKDWYGNDIDISKQDNSHWNDIRNPLDDIAKQVNDEFFPVNEKGADR